MGLVGLIAGVLAGVGISATYKKTEDGAWRRTFPVHHGLIGLAGIPVGVLMESPVVIGFSAGLALQDVGDFGDWNIGDSD